MVNQYFNENSEPSEQNLYQDLIDEAIQIYGRDIYYLPRTRVNLDPILGEDNSSEFNKAYIIEMYLENVDGFEGEKNFLSSIGLNIKKKTNFLVSNKRFNEEISNGPFNIPPSYIPQRTRPMEGDLLYFPLTRGLFEIMFADHEAVFYQAGKIYVWRLSCEMFKYSNEKFNTGIDEIDAIAVNHENNNSLVNDPISDNDNLKIRLDDLLDTNESADPFSLKNY